MRTVLCAVGLMLLVSTANAQTGGDGLGAIGYDYFPCAPSGVDNSSRQTETCLRRFRIGAGLPVPLSSSKRGPLLLPGLSYTHLGVERPKNLAPDGPAVDDLHSAMLSVMLIQPLSDRWTLMASVGVGIASDLSAGLNSDDWVVSGLAMGVYKLSDDFTLGGGVGYDRRTGDVSPLPLLALNWQPTSRLGLRGVLPASLEIRYRTAPYLTTSLEGRLDGERYHLDNKKFGLSRADLAFSHVTVGPALTFHAMSLLNLKLFGGMALYRRFEVFDERSSVLNGRLSSGAFVGLTLSVAPNGWRDEDPPLGSD